jgi:hypothetical protein
MAELCIPRACGWKAHRSPKVTRRRCGKLSTRLDIGFFYTAVKVSDLRSWNYFTLEIESWHGLAWPLLTVRCQDGGQLFDFTAPKVARIGQ